MLTFQNYGQVPFEDEEFFQEFLKNFSELLIFSSRSMFNEQEINQKYLTLIWGFFKGKIVLAWAYLIFRFKMLNKQITQKNSEVKILFNYKMKFYRECQRQEDKLFQLENSQINERTLKIKELAKPWLNNTKKSDQITFGEDYIQKSISQQKMIYRLQIFSMMVLMTLCILLISNYDNLLELQVIRNQKIVSSYDNSLGNSLELRYKFCPDHTNTFHVNCNQKENSLQYASIQFIKQTAFCRIPVLGNSHLFQFVAKWNLKFPDQQIKIESLNKQDKRQDLLALLQLYFVAGTYVSTTVPYSRIDQGSWKFTLTGFDTIFIDYLYKNEKEIYVPDYKKFMKVTLPYSPHIKFMIQQLINGKDMLQQCKERQCLIVKSLD